MGINKADLHNQLDCSPQHDYDNIVVVDMINSWCPTPKMVTEVIVKMSLKDRQYRTESNTTLDKNIVLDLSDDNSSVNSLELNDEKNRTKTIIITTVKIISLLLFLYFFICSLDFLSSAFRLVGSRAAGEIISDSELLKNPVVGLMIGVLVTVLVQSSSTSTSIVVTMVGSNIIKVREAIPIVMGANIGTSVTNTIVSLMQSSDRNEFRLAFAAATVHDMFNWLTVLVLLPIESMTHYLEVITDKLMAGQWNTDNSTNTEFLGKITKPFTKLVIDLDKKVLSAIATGNTNITKSMIKNGNSLFSMLQLSDTISGIILLIISLVMLCGCLILMVKVLNSMLKGQIAVVIKKTMNRNYVFPYSMFVDYFAIFVGCVLTILVQSSSIFTSTLTPLAGVGIISLERMYPLTLGSNIGTTTTGILAALAADSTSLRNTLQLAFCHLFFNITGIILFYPIPFMRWPISMARMLGNITAKYRWFSVLYLLVMFFLLPFFVFTLSLAGINVLIGIGGPILSLLFIIVIINLIQNNRPRLLPIWLQDWHFLPLYLHSLKPLDRQISRLVNRCSCCNCIR